MPNDAKLGLVVGVGLVIAVAVLFFHKEPPAGAPAGEAAPAGIVRPLPLTGAPPHATPAHPTAHHGAAGAGSASLMQASDGCGSAPLPVLSHPL